MTSSPGPTPSAIKATSNASVPDETPTACRRPVNAANSASNVTGYRVDVQKFLAQVPPETRFDYVIVDPPRTGLSRQALEGVIRVRPARVSRSSISMRCPCSSAGSWADASRHR